MGFIVKGVAMIVAVLVLAISAARWIGQQRDTCVFPVPLADGDWQGIRFFEMDEQELVAMLNSRLDVADSSAHLVMNAQSHDSYSVLEFDYAPEGTAPKPVLLYWANHSYSMMRDMRTDSRMALLRLGDVIVMLGPPARMSVFSREVMLHYPERNLQVLVALTEGRAGWARLTPANPVVGLSVLNRHTAYDREMTIYEPSVAWQGFGIYHFAP
jgi:hypothetical protein